MKGKAWVGIKFDNAVGDCTGKGARRQYFRCKPKFGKFLPPHYILPLSTNDMKDELAAMGGAKLWRQMDSNGNGLLSCAEFDKFIVQQLPQLHFAPAILQAFKRTGGDSVDNLLTAKHADALVANICYYVDLWVAFATGLSGDEGGLADRRLDEAASLGPALQRLSLDEDEDLAEVFSAMDADGGGVVRFQEFAAWVETRKPPPDMASVPEAVAAPKKRKSAKKPAIAVRQTITSNRRTGTPKAATPKQSTPRRSDSSKKKPKNFGNFRPLVAAIKGKEAVKGFGVGMRVKTQLEDTRAEGGVSEERGVVKYIGKFDSDMKGKTWVGIKFDNTVGDCTGKGARKQYFRCKPKFGKFLPPHYISLLSTNDMKDELAAMGGAKLWRQMDSNGNGLLSCAEFDKF